MNLTVLKKRLFPKTTQEDVRLDTHSSLQKGKHLILLNTPVIKNWLQFTGNSQKDLAEWYGCSVGYVSRWINNTEKLSGGVIAFLLNTTRMSFSRLFITINESDDRWFFGQDIWFRGQHHTIDEYRKKMSKIFDKVNSL